MSEYKVGERIKFVRTGLCLPKLPEDEDPRNATLPVHDRALLLYGSKRNEVLSLLEIEQYGLDSFADPDYLSIYGMLPCEWYGCGIRLLGRTAVECTPDALGDRIGRDVASVGMYAIQSICGNRPVRGVLQYTLLDSSSLAGFRGHRVRIRRERV